MAKYDWDRWSDGRVYRLYANENFTSLQGLRSAAQAQALRRDGRFSIKQEFRGNDNVILLRFIPNVKRTPSLAQSAHIDIPFIKRLIKLTHPDKHPIERKDEATAVTARLNALQDELRAKERRR